MLKGFRDFLMRGNVIDLAVAVVIGAAFGAVVARSPTTSSAGSSGSSAARRTSATPGVTINGSKVVYGSTLTALIQFVIVAAAIYFVVVMPMQAIAARRGRGEVAEPTRRRRPTRRAC